MADDALAEVLTKALCGRHDCGYPGCAGQGVGRCQTAPEQCEAARTALSEAGYVVIPREPTTADIERMARAIDPEVWEDYLPEARAAHAALVRGDD